MFDNDRMIAVGKITKLYGKAGELIVRLYDEFPYSDETYDDPFYVVLNGITTPIFIGSFAQQGKQKAVVEFDDFDNELRAQELVGLEIMAEIEGVDSDNFSLEMLVGYALNDKRSGKSGIITGFIDNPNNPLFEVDIDGVEIYVPAVEDIVLMIDTDSEYVDVNLPEGLLDLYDVPEGYEY